MIVEGLTKQKLLLFDKGIFYLVFSIWLFLDQDSKFLTYSPLLILFLYYIINKKIKRKNNVYFDKKFKYFPLLLLITWIYGVFVGLLNGNDNVFVNNAGILFFLSYYLIGNNNLNTSQLIKIIVYLTIASAIYYLYNLQSGLLSQIQITSFGLRLGGYSINGIFITSLIPILLFNIFFSKKKLIIKNNFINYFLLLTLLLIAVILVSSKGIYLSIVVTLIILFFFKLRQAKLLLFIPLITLIISLNIDLEKLTIFSTSDTSNLSRFAMADAMWSEFTFFGKGWGAKFQAFVLKSRDISGYSSELSYMNLIHKIGLFSSTFFFFYGWLLILILKLVKSKENDTIGTGLISLGMVTYLFTSIGNPSLFSPIFVFMTVMVLHLINKQLILSRNEK